MKNKKKMIIAGIALILLVIVGVVAVNISKKDSQREEIARQLELGKKQLTSLEYEEAIATFKNALAIDPKDRELLAGLVEAEEAYANSKVTILLADISSSEEAESYLVQMSEKEAILQEAIEELTKNEVIKDNPGYQETSDKLNSLIEEIQKEKEDAESKKKDFTSDFENQQEEVTEKESALSDEEIIGAIRKASEFAYNWFWISDREHVDEYDTYVDYDENGNPWEYKRVTYEGISSLDDVLDLTKHYFTEEVAEQLISQKDWYEQSNKIYVSEPDGLGGPEADYYDIKIVKENDIRYTITIYEYFGDELWEDPYDVHLEYIDGYWVFDKILVREGNPVPINVIEGDKLANDSDGQFDITGTWYSEEYDEVDGWATSYKTIFNPDGTVLQIGWRNEDHGTYEVSADGMCVTAYFKENYIDQPGDGMQLLGGYEYSVVYKLDPEKQCIYAAYSQEFKDALYSNAEDGVLQRH